MRLFYKVEPALPDVVDAKEVLAYLQQELQRLEIAFLAVQGREMEWLHVAPSRVREGLTVGADGTDWNPGGGQGVYTYYAGVWNKLG